MRTLRFRSLRVASETTEAPAVMSADRRHGDKTGKWKFRTNNQFHDRSDCRCEESLTSGARVANSYERRRGRFRLG